MEAGADLGGHISKTLDRFLGEFWDYVLTVRDPSRRSSRCGALARSAASVELGDDRMDAFVDALEMVH